MLGDVTRWLLGEVTRWLLRCDGAGGTLRGAWRQVSRVDGTGHSLAFEAAAEGRADESDFFTAEDLAPLVIEEPRPFFDDDDADPEAFFAPSPRAAAAAAPPPIAAVALPDLQHSGLTTV